MAKTQRERDDDATAKRKELGEVELRHRVVAGTRQILKELMGWHGIKEIAEAVQLLVMNNHALGPVASLKPAVEHRKTEEDLRHRMRPGAIEKLQDLMNWRDIKDAAAMVELLIVEAYALGANGSAHLLAIPRHDLHVSQNVARQIMAEGIRQADRDLRQELKDEWRD